MGLFSSPAPKVPNTVSDEQMRQLGERARKASPHLTSMFDPRAIQHRKASSLQRSKADSN
jgi:hypothetical protein